MTPTRLTALAGFILVLAGIALLAAQVAFPDRFAGDAKGLQFFGVSLSINEMGYGAIVIGAILLLATSAGRESQTGHRP